MDKLSFLSYSLVNYRINRVCISEKNYETDYAPLSGSKALFGAILFNYHPKNCCAGMTQSIHSPGRVPHDAASEKLLQ